LNENTELVVLTSQPLPNVGEALLQIVKTPPAAIEEPVPVLGNA
jgi:hypothetical protein